MENFKLLTILVILSVLFGCKEEPLVPEKKITPPAVELSNVSATKTKINLGEETQISWVTNGTVSVNGQKIEGSFLVVKPIYTTVYKIISSNGYSNKKDSITIEVIQPDPEIMRRSAMFARAPWTLYEDLTFSEGKWCSYDVSVRNTHQEHIKPGIGYWTVIAPNDTISHGELCSITMDSLIWSVERFKYELSDSILVLYGFSNTSVVLKYKR